MLSAIFAPTLVFAETESISTVADTLISLINDVFVPLLFGVAFIVFLYGVAKTYIFSAGNETEVEKGHKIILWGIIGFVVMISLWGLVNIVTNTVGIENSEVPDYPNL